VTSEVFHPGELLCTVLWAGRRAWSVSGFCNLYLFEHALVVTGTAWSEMMDGLPKPWDGTRKQRKHRIDETLTRQRGRVETSGALPIAELVKRHPDTRVLPWAAVTEARLRKGWADSRLALVLDDGAKVKWVWGRGDGLFRRYAPNPPSADVEAVLREILGATLALR
jgi:hypothetical protein